MVHPEPPPRSQKETPYCRPLQPSKTPSWVYVSASYSRQKKHPFSEIDSNSKTNQGKIQNNIFISAKRPFTAARLTNKFSDSLYKQEQHIHFSKWTPLGSKYVQRMEVPGVSMTQVKNGSMNPFCWVMICTFDLIWVRRRQVH